MKVETIQEAIEGAPSIIYPDGNGGAVFVLVTDEAVEAVAKKMAEDNHWSEEEESNLYQAILTALEVMALPERWA